MIGRRSLIALYGACLALVASGVAAVSTAYSAGVALVSRGFEIALAAVARPFTMPPAFGRLAIDGPALAYEAPPQHLTRYEAGLKRVSAARNT